MSNWENQHAYELEQAGLSLALQGDFAGADRAYSEAMIEIAPTDVLALGHLQRDWVRVYAGMGLFDARNTAMDNAINLHRQLSIESVAAGCSDVASSELGATLGVSARVELAEAIDAEDAVYRDISIDLMAEDYLEAFGLLNNAATNQDYRHQVLAHGSLALTTFGGSEHQTLAEKFIDEATKIEHEMTKDRRRAMTAARYAAEFRPLKNIVKVLTIKSVAGPYRIPK